MIRTTASEFYWNYSVVTATKSSCWSNLWVSRTRRPVQWPPIPMSKEFWKLGLVCADDDFSQSECAEHLLPSKSSNDVKCSCKLSALVDSTFGISVGCMFIARQWRFVITCLSLPQGGCFERVQSFLRERFDFKEFGKWATYLRTQWFHCLQMPGVLVPERGTNDPGPASKRHFGGVKVDPLSAADLGHCQHFPVGRRPASPAPDHSYRERKIVVAGSEGLHGWREDGVHVARCSLISNGS